MDLPVTIRGIRHVSYNVCKSTAGIAPNGCVQQKASATSVRNHHRIVYIAKNSRLFRCEQQQKKLARSKPPKRLASSPRPYIHNNVYGICARTLTKHSAANK